MKSTSQRWTSAIALASASLLLVACATDELIMTDEDAFSVIYSTAFDSCSGCHAPEANGFDEATTERTLDFSTRDQAFMTITQGMVDIPDANGNFTGCNGVPFIGSSPETSILVAAFDGQIRRDFTVADTPSCDGDSISDMTRFVGQIDAADLDMLKQWITDGTPNQ